MPVADVIVVGGGVAGLSAALAVRERGATVLLLERAPLEERGGNTRFANGAMRSVYGGVDDIERFVPGLTAEERKGTDFGTYTREQYTTDLARVTEGRADPNLVELLVDASFDTMLWLQRHGVRFAPMYAQQGRMADGKIRFWGGSAVEVRGAGRGLVDALFSAIEMQPGTVRYETQALDLLERDGAVEGLRVREGRNSYDLHAKAVILACGGFEANPEWRARYLGAGWDLVKVRGSRFNTGDGLRMAIEAGAAPRGHWSGCHAASWGLHAPAFGDPGRDVSFKRDDFMYGIMVNARGERFVDEGADIRALTYAKYGRAILEQPGQFAWQIFDAKSLPLLHEEYRNHPVVRAQTIEALADQLDGVDRAGFLATVASYNGAIARDVPFDPAVKDGRSTQGLALPKSNWATALDEPPFEAHAVGCGITFTFGGIAVDERMRVVDVVGDAVPGLYAAGSLVGGLFYFNYPGGSGLMSAAVFGRTAGLAAAAHCSGAA